ncbi:MAG TPA: nitrous oxide reductase accessory protein NosL [Bacteroidota bacterium]|nr:nitrous oxide reductase accessory protein NosL [Bacteroidota bacterium]
MRLRPSIRAIAIVICILVQHPASSAQTTCGPKEPGTRDKCPVCGMFVQKYPRWWSEILFADGTCRFFDGPKDMFKFYLRPGKYGGSNKKKICKIYVRDYYSLNWLDAQDPFYVIESDIDGPMGRELVPLKSAEDAQEFKDDHHGTRVLRFNDVDWELVLRLSLGENM